MRKAEEDRVLWSAKKETLEQQIQEVGPELKEKDCKIGESIRQAYFSKCGQDKSKY